MPLLVVPRRDRKLNRLVKASPIVPVRRGERLFKRKEEASEVVLVRSGHVRVVTGRGRRRTRTMAVAGPWELAGESAIGPKGVHRNTCIAGEASEVQRLNGRAVFRVLKTTERTFAAFVEAQVIDLECAAWLAAGAGGPTAAARLAHVLVRLAQRWGEPSDEGVLVPQRVTHQVLADLAGSHRSTVTTTLNDWIYEGLLGDARHGFLVPKVKKLRKIAKGAPKFDVMR